MHSSELRTGVRGRVLELLGEHPMTAQELAAVLDLHVTTVRFHLDRLVDAGLVIGARRAAHAVGRPSLEFSLVAGADGAADTGTGTDQAASEPLRALAAVLVEVFHADAAGNPMTPEAAGERWARAHAREAIGMSDSDLQQARTPGQWLAKAGRLVDLLDSWGYEPRLSGYDGGTAVELRLLACPFEDLARADPDVVCGIHAGLIRGAMAEFGETDSEVEVEPFTDPPLCGARIATHTVFTRGRGA